MSKKVFLNTSPIQYIHQLGLIRIVKELFGKVYVPAEVHEELNRGREEGIELPNLEVMDFIEIMEPKAISFSKLVRDLGKGETAVILLGLENPGSLVILDDLLARSVARGLGVKLTGTAGILINAKMKGLIKVISPYLDQLEHLGFHLAPEHKSLILKKAGEE